MGKRFYMVTRDLHLYAGLFLSPFVLVFALSVFWLVHVSTAPPRGGTGTVVKGFQAPAGIERLTGREQVEALRPVLDGLGVRGEIGFIRRIARERRLVAPVSVPGRETTVDLNLATGAATVTERRAGLADALIYLHKMPGPHNANIRVNSGFMRAWRVLADAATYGILFLSLSGVYLWTALRAERRIGLALVALGAISFFGLLYAIAR